jgi:DNA-damage-inducible protein J
MMEAWMAATAFVRARINEEVRDEAAKVLADLGLTISDVMRMTLTRIARDKALPPELLTPNPTTRAAMAEARAMGKARHQTATALLNAVEHDAKG